MQACNSKINVELMMFIGTVIGRAYNKLRRYVIVPGLTKNQRKKYSPENNCFGLAQTRLTGLYLICLTNWNEYMSISIITVNPNRPFALSV